MSHGRSPIVSRKVIPIKRAEDDPLTRRDLQYDILYYIFSDPRAVFTNPWPDSSGAFPEGRLTFRELYIKTILNSTKATKNFCDRMRESDEFAEDYAMLALLVNVGRINTTMSFFPEMKTTLRSYHPVPALQRTSGNLQDAPRIKHILKAVRVEGEPAIPPRLPVDILSRLNSGFVPPTTIFNLIFGLVNHSSSVGQLHLPDNIDFVDLFMRMDLSSESRAKAFLWLCFNYLESSMPSHPGVYHSDDIIINPFGDPRRGGKPSLVFLNPQQVALENVDPPEEILLAKNLLRIRADFVRSQQLKGKDRQTMPSSASASGSIVGDDVPGFIREEMDAGKLNHDHPFTVKIPGSTSKNKRSTAAVVGKGRKQIAVKSTSTDNETMGANVRPHAMDIQNQYPRHQPLDSSADLEDVRYALYREDHTSLRPSLDIYQTANSVPRLSFLEYAWRQVTSVDPLADSDSDDGGGDDDEHAHYEYTQRLRVVSRFLGTSLPGT